jgi:predicted secreted protein
MRTRSPLAAAALIALVLLLPACNGGSTTTAGYQKGNASVLVNDVLCIDLGDYNSSIGDSWYLVKNPDKKVLKNEGQKLESTCKAGEAGCGGRLYWEFLAYAKGSTSVRLQYCYRSTQTRCDNGPGRGPKDPVNFTITVN